jgi:hypothetical protein
VYEGESGYEVKQSEKKDTPAFERAVRAAARWIYTAERDNIPYQLWTEGGGSGSAYQEKWQQELLYSPESHELDKLAQARISTSQATTPSLRTEMLDRMAIGSRIVVLTGRMDDALVDWVLCATVLGYRVEVQLTDQTNRDVGNESLEQLRQRGVQIHWITDGSLPSMRKAEVTDVGA